MAQNGNGFTKGLLIGGLVGAAIALLYAPKSGVDLRRHMGKKATGWKKGVGKYMRRLEKTSDELLDKARDTMDAAAEVISGNNGDDVVRGAKEIVSKSRGR